MYQLTFYVPSSHIAEVKAAVFAAGAGRVGDYEHCAWQVEGRVSSNPCRAVNRLLVSMGN